jgi:hypothetical protein
LQLKRLSLSGLSLLFDPKCYYLIPKNHLINDLLGGLYFGFGLWTIPPEVRTVINGLLVLEGFGLAFVVLFVRMILVMIF